MERFVKMGLTGLAIVLALGACSKSSENASASSSPATTAAVTTAASPMQNGVAANDGAKVYQTNCSSCHGAAGAGLAGTFPPLAGNPVVNGDPKNLIHIVKFGLNGKVQVAGQSYNGMMPAWGQQLSNADIANVLTYVRASWGNSASALTEADVSAVAQ